MTQIQERAKEALCSAFYNMPFTRFLGEVDDPLGASKYPVAWFRFQLQPEINRNARQDPKQMVVAIRTEPSGVVAVQCSWLNLTGDKPMRGEQTLRFHTAGREQWEVKAATESVALQILDMFQQVLSGIGIAGKIDKLAPVSNDEVDPETDMALPE